MMNLLKTLVKEEEGQGLVEYALIIAGIAIVVFVAVQTFGGKLTALFNKIGTELEDATTPPSGG